MSDNEQEWFVSERARSLAMMHLTRHKELVVMNAGQGVGLQFIVYITTEKGESGVRPFAIFLRGTKSAVTEDHLNKVLRPALKSFVRIGAFPYPVCLFHFTMDDDQGYYTWVAEPVVTPDEGPRLVMHDIPHCQKLTTTALGEIVEKVDRWYDVFFKKIAVKAS